MQTIKETARAYAAILVLLAAAPTVNAASSSQDFVTSARANYIFLFTDNPSAVPPITFTSLDLSGEFSTWNINSLSSSVAIFSGPTLAAGAGNFTLGFDYSERRVSFQWAEVIFDSVNYSIQDSGTAAFQANRRGPGGSWSSSAAFFRDNARFVDDYFSGLPAASVPLPNSVVLLFSAAAFMGFSRRRSAAQPGSLSDAL